MSAHPLENLANASFRESRERKLSKKGEDYEKQREDARRTQSNKNKPGVPQQSGEAPEPKAPEPKASKPKASKPKASKAPVAPKAKRRRTDKVIDRAGLLQKPAIRRLCRRGGVKRISGLIYTEVANRTHAFVDEVLEKAIIYCVHAHRKTVTPMDIIYALKKQGKVLYGFGG
jgi:histone H4